MTAFFIPVSSGQAGEDAYQELRRQTEAQLGRPPSQRRIRELWARRGNVDCVTTVGAPDPISGEIVTAIFDMGHHQPFVLYHQDPDDPSRHSCEVLASVAYSFAEFSA